MTAQAYQILIQGKFIGYAEFISLPPVHSRITLKDDRYKGYIVKMHEYNEGSQFITLHCREDK